MVGVRQRGGGRIAVLSAEHGQAHRAKVGPFGQQTAARGVAEFNLINVDVTPGAGRRINDFDASGLAFKLAHVPIVPFQLFFVLSRRGADDLAVDEQIDARLAGFVAAADQEADEMTVYRKLRRCERPYRIIVSGPAVDQLLPLVARHTLLAW